jgi:hypothetical protein
MDASRCRWSNWPRGPRIRAGECGGVLPWEWLRGIGPRVLVADPGGCQDVGRPGAVGRVGCHRHRNLGRCRGCLRRDHQQDHTGLGRSGHPDRVGVHMAEPAHADAAAVHGHAAGSGVPGVEVERHPGDRPKGGIQGRNELGELGIRIPRPWPPSTVDGSCAGHRGVQLQPQLRRRRRSGGRRSDGGDAGGCGHVVGSILGSPWNRPVGNGGGPLPADHGRRPAVDVTNAGVRRLGYGQVARAGVGCGLGSGRGIGGTGVGAPGRLADGWGWPGWLVGPLSQWPMAGVAQVRVRVDDQRAASAAVGSVRNCRIARTAPRSSASCPSPPRRCAWRPTSRSSPDQQVGGDQSDQVVGATRTEELVNTTPRARRRPTSHRPAGAGRGPPYPATSRGAGPAGRPA